MTSDGSEPRLDSARAIFQKARIEKIGKNEPIWGLDKFKKKDLDLISILNFTFLTFIQMFRLIYYFVNVITMSQVERRKKTYVSEN